MSDPMGELFARLAATLDVVAADEQAAREARYNSPEARAARSARSRKAAATMRARREREAAAEAARWALEPTGPTCDAMDIYMDARETFCTQEPDHDGDHENMDGHAWPNEED